MAHAGLLLARTDAHHRTVALEGKVAQQAQVFAGVRLADGQVHQEVVEVVGGDEVLLVEADAIAKLAVQLLRRCHVEERVVVVGQYRVEGVSLVLAVVAERYHQSVLQVALRLQILEEGSGCVVDESHRPSEVLVALDEVDLRQLSTVLILVEEVGGVLEGVLGLGFVIEAAVCGSRVALSEAELEVGLVEVGVAVERKGLVLRSGVDHSTDVVVVHIRPVGCAEARRKASDKSSVTELLVEAMRPSYILTFFEDNVHFICRVAVEHWEDVMRRVVAQRVILVKLIGLCLHLSKRRRRWLNGRVATEPRLLLEPPHEPRQLYVRLKATH